MHMIKVAKAAIVKAKKTKAGPKRHALIKKAVEKATLAHRALKRAKRQVHQAKKAKAHAKRLIKKAIRKTKKAQHAAKKDSVVRRAK